MEENMTKNVQILIEGTIVGGDGEEQKVVTKLKGIYIHKNEKHFIHYDESGEELDTLKNTIKVTSKEVVMSKKGSQATNMIFDEKAMTMAHYDTPYGSFEFGVKTKYMNVKIEEDLIEVALEYSLSAEDGPISENKVYIKVEAIQE